MVEKLERHGENRFWRTGIDQSGAQMLQSVMDWKHLLAYNSPTGSRRAQWAKRWRGHSRQNGSEITSRRGLAKGSNRPRNIRVPAVGGASRRRAAVPLRAWHHPSSVPLEFSLGARQGISSLAGRSPKSPPTTHRGGGYS